MMKEDTLQQAAEAYAKDHVFEFKGEIHLDYSTALEIRSESFIAGAEWMAGEADRLREEVNDLEDALEKKQASASMWAMKAMEAGNQRAELSRENVNLKDELREALLQLQYLESKYPTGTTPIVINRIKIALNENL